MFWASGEGGQGVRSWGREDHCRHSDNASRGSTLPSPHWPLGGKAEGERGRNHSLSADKETEAREGRTTVSIGHGVCGGQT